MSSLKMELKTHSREIMGGLTTFLTMAYIVIVNPQIMSGLHAGIPLSAALTSTVLLCFLMTLFAGLYTKLPYAVGPGMGINIFVSYSLILGKNIPWQTAMGLTFISGCLFFLISLSPLRKSFYYALPDSLKHGFSAGIGIFLAYIGLKSLGIFRADPNTFIGLAHFQTSSFLGILGFLMAFYLFQKKKSYAFLAPIIFITILSLFTKQVSFSHQYFSTPDFHNLFQLDIPSALRFSFLSTILSLLLTCAFDSTTTLIALIEVGKFKDEKGHPKNFKESMVLNASSSLVSSLLGTTPGTVFLESAAGIEAGAKSGLASIVTSLCFLPCLFLSPLISLIPTYATAPVLIFVGILMTSSLSQIQERSLEEVIPVFLAMILMPLSSSITLGVFAGVLSYLLLKLVLGKGKSVPLPLYGIGTCCLISILLEAYF
jgi:AGZA family xanthine/uracil permease-like MFS transporter